MRQMYSCFLSKSCFVLSACAFKHSLQIVVFSCAESVSFFWTVRERGAQFDNCTAIWTGNERPLDRQSVKSVSLITRPSPTSPPCFDCWLCTLLGHLITTRKNWRLAVSSFFGEQGRTRERLLLNDFSDCYCCRSEVSFLIEPLLTAPFDRCLVCEGSRFWGGCFFFLYFASSSTMFRSLHSWWRCAVKCDSAKRRRARMHICNVSSWFVCKFAPLSRCQPEWVAGARETDR